MKEHLKRWIGPFSISILTLFGVFVLPFLLPPPYLAGVSAANVAGFNNKVSALAAAVLGVAVFLVNCRSPRSFVQLRDGDFGKLPNRLVLITVAICASIDSFLSAAIAAAQVRFFDASYFIEQIGDRLDYGRKLYDQIEFPYGPIIFYGPVFVHWLLSPWQVSLAGAYFVTLVAEHMIGLVLVAYVLNRLPILRKWKIVFFLCCAPHAIPFTYGLNYTLLRAVGSVAMLVAAARLKSVWKTAGCVALGQVMSLGISPEMGFAFGAASLVYAGYMVFRVGNTWLPVVASPFLAGITFFVVVGPGYLRMLKLFAHGVFNLIVQPLPHILLFLFVVVWLVPVGIARSLRSGESSTPLLIALYVFSLALLPVAFGRADPGHIFFNGVTAYLLSFVAIRMYSLRSQTIWVVCVVGISLWTCSIDFRNRISLLRWSVSHGVARMGSDAQAQSLRTLAEKVSPAVAAKLLADRIGDDTPAVMSVLHGMVGNDPVATPEEVAWTVEQALKQSGQYTPTFYCFQVAVLDATAEAHEIQEFNDSKWALVLKNSDVAYSETPASTADAVGFDLHYPERRTPHVAGREFMENLRENWQPYGEVGDYELYKRREAAAP